MAQATPEAHGAGVAWNLDPLVEGEGEAGVERLLDEASEGARAFADAHAGRVAQLDSGGLAAAMRELVEIAERTARAANWAMLRFSTDTADPARGALLQRVQERAAQIETRLLFFELEWAELEEQRAEELLADPALDFARHHLRVKRRFRPHLLSEPEERILTEKEVTGASAWTRLFTELTSALTVDVEDVEEPLSLDGALANLTRPDRDLRRRSAEGVTAALAPGLPTRAFILNTLAADKATDDRLRSYPHWLAARNLANEASDEAVTALVEAVGGRYSLPQRWYELKAQLLGIERLADYDRAASVSEQDEEVPWDAGRELVLDCYGSFSSRLGELAREFFDGRFIDAPPRPNKRGGAFCASTTPSAHPYLMLNYTATRNDVLTLAHELGHGLHYALAAGQGLLHYSTPLTTAETASVFGETIVLGRLLEQAPDAESRLSLLAEALDGSIATIFRQVAMHTFEDRLHNERRERGELSSQRIGELWIASQSELFGDSVAPSDGYELWWSYVPHFVNVPGYVYAYAFGQLLAMSVYRRYEQEGESFVPRYLEMLAAGGSRAPEEIAAIAGIDLTDPGFWESGLDLVEEQLAAARAAAREARGVEA